MSAAGASGSGDRHWNYRMVQRLDGSFAVHQVHYVNGKETGMTADPVSLYGESPEEIRGDLIVIAGDVRRRPIFVEPEHW